MLLNDIPQMWHGTDLVGVRYTPAWAVFLGTLATGGGAICTVLVTLIISFWVEGAKTTE